MADIRPRQQDLPATSHLLSEDEFLSLTGLARESLDELVQLEWLSCVKTREAVLFQMSDILRVRKLDRLCGDFELSTLGGTIVVDLLERIAELEDEVRHLRSRL
ncbi:MAG: chaperone modulator CbpM [Candidatus Desulfovibrio faecigallinarum]|nr:chaperone modulator CbpM [Candidatus Desulfovibrio faecigallinarum]OUO49847.1 hypothetical protein B5F76_13085 [Desulfovibrio sp. An276]